jgi:hypothetical protein
VGELETELTVSGAEGLGFNQQDFSSETSFHFFPQPKNFRCSQAPADAYIR